MPQCTHVIRAKQNLHNAPSHPIMLRASHVGLFEHMVYVVSKSLLQVLIALVIDVIHKTPVMKHRQGSILLFYTSKASSKLAKTSLVELFIYNTIHITLP